MADRKEREAVVRLAGGVLIATDTGKEATAFCEAIYGDDGVITILDFYHIESGEHHNSNQDQAPT